MIEKLVIIDYVYLNFLVYGVFFMLNFVIGIFFIVSIGVNVVAGYIIDDVLICVGICMIIVYIRREFYWYCNV